MDPYDAVKEFYLNQLKQGIPLPTIDEMDIGFYFELIRYQTELEEKEQFAYIDDIL
jgi:hypothetical protein